MTDRTLGADSGSELVVVMPVYNDWEPARMVLRDLDAELADLGHSARVLLIDDASSEVPAAGWPGIPLRAIQAIDVVSLRFNVGHQRAIAVGLCLASEQDGPSAVLVMDADGEDRPGDLAALWRAYRSENAQKIVFAQRKRRSEGLLFSLGYHLYRLVHWLLTGIPIRVGNFSLLPRSSLERIVHVPELWNHYAAAVFRSGLAFTQVPTRRGSRIGGRSQMNWTSLVIHGLSALAVFGGIVGVRLLLIALLLVGLIVVGLAGVVASAMWSGHAPSANVILGGGLLLVLMSQVVMVAGGLALSLLNSRANLNSFPVRDYRNLVGSVRRVHPHGT